MKKIETKNVILREFVIEDAKKAYKNWAGVEEIAEKTDFCVHSSVEETKEIIKRGLGGENEDVCTWAIVLKENMEPIGFIRIYEISENNKTCKLTWAIGKKWWGKEISEEAIKEIINYCFEEKKMNVISSTYYSNIEELRSPILEKVGMKREAVLKNRKIEDGKFLNKIIYSIIN